MRKFDSKRRRGFTLVEVLLVLVILVIIASLAVTAYGPIQKQAYVQAAQTQIKAFEQPLELYRTNIGSYPSTAEGLQALLSPPAMDRRNMPDRYMDTIPPDPWKRPYGYAYPPQQNRADKPDIWSAGPDGQEGTDDDVVNWE